MSDTKTQSTASFPGFGPGFAPQEVLSQMQQFGAQWAASAREQLDQWTSAAEEVEGWQREASKRASEATDEVAKLVKSGLEYGGTLWEQWRATSTAAMQRTLDLMAPKA